MTESTEIERAGQYRLVAQRAGARPLDPDRGDGDQQPTDAQHIGAPHRDPHSSGLNIAIWRGGAAAGMGGRCHGCGDAKDCDRSLRGCRRTRAAGQQQALAAGLWSYDPAGEQVVDALGCAVIELDPDGTMRFSPAEMSALGAWIAREGPAIAAVAAAEAGR